MQLSYITPCFSLRMPKEFFSQKKMPSGARGFASGSRSGRISTQTKLQCFLQWLGAHHSNLVQARVRWMDRGRDAWWRTQEGHRAATTKSRECLQLISNTPSEKWGAWGKSHIKESEGVRSKWGSTNCMVLSVCCGWGLVVKFMEENMGQGGGTAPFPL